MANKVFPTDFTAKVAPLADADYILISDSAAANVIKKVKWSVLMSDTPFGSLYTFENATVTPIVTATVWQPIKNLAAGAVSTEWTAGTYEAVTINSIADATVLPGGTGGDIRINTVAPHTIAEDDIVFLTGATGYDEVYTVTHSETTLNFDVTAVWGATGTGTGYKGTSLIAGTGAAGKYSVTLGMTADATGNGTFRFAVFVNGVVKEEGYMEPTLAAGVKTQLASSGIITIADADLVDIAVVNDTDAKDIVPRHLDLNLTRISIT